MLDIERIEITADHCNEKLLRQKRDADFRKSLKHEKPAYVKRRADKAEAQQRVPVERQACALRRKREPNRILAAEITRYVDRNGGEVTGTSLDCIHAEFALVLLGDDSRQALVRIGAAMQYAIAKSWLEEKEAGCAFSIPTANAA